MYKVKIVNNPTIETTHDTVAEVREYIASLNEDEPYWLPLAAYVAFQWWWTGPNF